METCREIEVREEAMKSMLDDYPREALLALMYRLTMEAAQSQRSRRYANSVRFSTR
jgi:hypothetical protein